MPVRTDRCRGTLWRSAAPRLAVSDEKMSLALVGAMHLVHERHAWEAGMEQISSRPEAAPRKPVGNRNPSAEDITEARALAVFRVAPEIEEVTLDTWPVGYIERVGHVFVALAGAHLDRAVECGQSVDHDAALRQVIASLALPA